MKERLMPFSIKLFHLSISVIAGLILSSFAAQLMAEPQKWSQSEWILQIDQEKPIIANCETDVCAKTNKERVDANAKIPTQQTIKEWVEPEIVRIGVWMKGMGYPRPNLAISWRWRDSPR